VEKQVAVDVAFAVKVQKHGSLGELREKYAGDVKISRKLL